MDFTRSEEILDAEWKETFLKIHEIEKARKRNDPNLAAMILAAFDDIVPLEEIIKIKKIKKKGRTNSKTQQYDERLQRNNRRTQ